MKANTAGQNGNAAVHEMHGMSGPPFTNAVVHSSHNQHAGHSATMFRDKFWLSLVLTLRWSFGHLKYSSGLVTTLPSCPDRDSCLLFWARSFSCTAERFLFKVHAENFPLASRA